MQYLSRLCLLTLIFSVRENASGFHDEVQDVAALLNLHPDTGLNISQFLDRHNYTLETHTVTTQDGYILTIHRIPYGRNESPPTNSSQTSKPAVFLMHGLLSSSMDYLKMGPDHSLGLILADAGYDVWIGNSRGTTHSRNHTTLDPDADAAFWDFSFHELGIYDNPAMIDHVLTQTGQKNLTYIGHSQGTTSFFVMASEVPEYNDKINLMIALAPVTYMTHINNPFAPLLAQNVDLIRAAFGVLNIHELLPHSQELADLETLFCNDDSGIQIFCKEILYIIGGFDESQMNSTMLTVIFTTFPAGSSVRQLLHYLQEIKSGYFRQYDYGLIENSARYNSFTPPVYNTALVTAPVAIYYSQNDLLSSVTDAKQLIAELPNVVKDRLIGFKYFNHFDFIFAKDVKSLLYDDIMQLLPQFH